MISVFLEYLSLPRMCPLSLSILGHTGPSKLRWFLKNKKIRCGVSFELKEGESGWELDLSNFEGYSPHREPSFLG